VRFGWEGGLGSRSRIGDTVTVRAPVRCRSASVVAAAANQPFRFGYKGERAEQERTRGDARLRSNKGETKREMDEIKMNT